MTIAGCRISKGWVLGALLCASFFLHFVSRGNAEEKGKLIAKTAPIFIAVSFHEKQPALAPLAERISKAVGGSSFASPGNPVCCVWLELGGVTVDPERPGYLITHGEFGSVINASSLDQMDLAVSHFLKEGNKPGGKFEFPVGVATSLPVNQ